MSVSVWVEVQIDCDVCGETREVTAHALRTRYVTVEKKAARAAGWTFHRSEPYVLCDLCTETAAQQETKLSAHCYGDEIRCEEPVRWMGLDQTGQAHFACDFHIGALWNERPYDDDAFNAYLDGATTPSRTGGDTQND